MTFKPFGWHWNELGNRNPFGAILAGPGGELSDWQIDEFFATGRTDVAHFMTELARVSPSIPRRRALDFGCGVGRIARGLAEHFESVTGVDVARSMVVRARALNRMFPRCRFVVNRAAHLRRFPTGTFDVVYSRLVLQHIKPRLVRRYLPELVRVLAPGGVLMFQLPGVIELDPEELFCSAPVTGPAIKRRLPRGLVNVYRRFKYRLIVDDTVARMEIYGVERGEVLALIGAAGGRVLQVRSDQSHGTDDEGFEYWVTK